MNFRKQFKNKQTSLLLPFETVEELDSLSKQTSLNRSEVATYCIKSVLTDDEKIDQLFGVEVADEEEGGEEN